VNSEKKSADRIRILVADANAMFCELVRGALKRRRRFEVVACATNLKELVETLYISAVDVALVGAHLKDGKGSGVRAVQQMRRLRPHIRSVVLLEGAEQKLMLEAFRAGTRGVFRRSEPNLDVLSKCVDRVHAGQIWASNVEVEQLLDAFRSSAPITLTNSRGVTLLSKQESRIAWLVAEGRTNREIASHLDLSEHTVKNYLFKIFDKLGISNRVELVLYAMSREEQSPAASEGQVGNSPSKQAS
jgi:DNA-binding NarL/FixJ family response regulator